MLVVVIIISKISSHIRKSFKFELIETIQSVDMMLDDTLSVRIDSFSDNILKVATQKQIKQKNDLLNKRRDTRVDNRTQINHNCILNVLSRSAIVVLVAFLCCHVAFFWIVLWM